MHQFFVANFFLASIIKLTTECFIDHQPQDNNIDKKACNPMKINASALLVVSGSKHSASMDEIFLKVIVKIPQGRTLECGQVQNLSSLLFFANNNTCKIRIIQAASELYSFYFTSR